MIAYHRSGGKMPAPWLLIRRELAREWGVRPWEIDPDEHADEIGLTLELWQLEAEHRVREHPHG